MVPKRRDVFVLRKNLHFQGVFGNAGIVPRGKFYENRYLIPASNHRDYLLSPSSALLSP